MQTPSKIKPSKSLVALQVPVPALAQVLEQAARQASPAVHAVVNRVSLRDNGSLPFMKFVFTDALVHYHYVFNPISCSQLFQVYRDELGTNSMRVATWST